MSWALIWAQYYYRRSFVCTRLVPNDHLDLLTNLTSIAFLLLIALYALALVSTATRDPGICATLTKDALKPVRSKFPQTNNVFTNSRHIYLIYE